MNRKLIVIIPAYEPPQTFKDYSEKLSQSVDSLIVVNDGSGEAFNDTFSQIASLPNTRVISYDKNMGKGFALKKAFKFCIDNFSDDDIIVTADCDGQHCIKDVLRVFNVACAYPNKLILGSRNFDSENVPKRSRAGNTQTRRLYRIFYSLKLYDTQTGLRGISVSRLNDFCNIKGNRFEYEMNMLIFAKKKHIPIIELPIETIYPKRSEDHVSHFKTFSDSMRVLGAVLSNLGWYAVSSCLSAVIDVFIFFVISNWLLPEVNAVHSLIATVTARVLSSVFNFTFNYKYVFNGVSKKSIIRYYILWLCQLSCSYGIVFLFVNVLGLNSTVVYIVGSLCLALISYQIQSNWVFKNKSDGNFYGAFAKLELFFAKLFSKEYRCNVIPYNEPVVYVCRHLNMHGPYTLLKWLDRDVHLMVLSVFFNRDTCYKQFNDFTLSERRGKKKKPFSFKAFVSSIFVPLSVRSIKAIPVHRNDGSSMITFRRSMDCLLNGESVAVFPDIDYTASYDTVSDIYDGFLFLGELYKRKTGKSLKFIPLVIDEKLKVINENEAVVIDSFKENVENIKAELIKKINVAD